MPNKFVKVAPSWESVGKFKGGGGAGVEGKPWETFVERAG